MLIWLLKRTFRRARPHLRPTLHVLSRPNFFGDLRTSTYSTTFYMKGSTLLPGSIRYRPGFKTVTAVSGCAGYLSPWADDRVRKCISCQLVVFCNTVSLVDALFRVCAHSSRAPIHLFQLGWSGASTRGISLAIHRSVYFPLTTLHQFRRSWRWSQQ